MDKKLDHFSHVVNIFLLSAFGLALLLLLIQVKWSRYSFEEGAKIFSQFNLAKNSEKIAPEITLGPDYAKNLSEVEHFLLGVERSENVKILQELETSFSLLKKVQQSPRSIDIVRNLKNEWNDLIDFLQVRNQKDLAEIFTQTLIGLQQIENKAVAMDVKELTSLIQNVRKEVEVGNYPEDIKRACLEKLSGLFRFVNQLNRLRVDVTALSYNLVHIKEALTSERGELQRVVGVYEGEWKQLKLWQTLFPLVLLGTLLGLFFFKNRQIDILRDEKSIRWENDFNLPPETSISPVVAESNPGSDEIKNSELASLVLNGLPHPFIILNENLRVLWMNQHFKKSFELTDELLASTNLNWEFINRFTDFDDAEVFSRLRGSQDLYSREIKMQLGPKGEIRQFEMYMTELTIKEKRLYYVFYYPINKPTTDANFYEHMYDATPMVMVPVPLNEREHVLSLNEIIDKTITHFSRKIQNLGVIVDCRLDEDLYIARQMKNMAEVFVRIFDSALITLSQVEEVNCRKLCLEYRSKGDNHLLRFTLSARETRFFNDRLKRLSSLLETMHVKSHVMNIRDRNNLFTIELDLSLSNLVEKRMPFNAHKLELS